MEKLIYILTIFMISVSSAYGQNVRSMIRGGNKDYRAGKHPQSEIKYRKALESNPYNPQASYNLGCAMMKQGRDSLAIEQFEKASKQENNKLRRAKSYHNMGVILHKQKNYGEAIEAYKNALRNNPNNNDTRYNLALCQRQLKQQQNQKNQQRNKNNKDNKQNKNNQNKDKQNEDNNNKKDKNNDKQSQNERMDRQNAEQLMNAAMREEQATHDRLKKAMQQPGSRKTNKNW